MLKIIADENILLAEQVFGTIGDVVLLPGRELDRAAVRDADALIVRSTTRVDAELLQGSRVRFVGTATIGTDHIDRDYLQQRGIAFADAAGSSADAVAEYVFAAITQLVIDTGARFRDLSLGVIGVGAIGSRVARYGRMLGMNVLLNDPPLARSSARPDFLPLDEVLTADIVTLHVPLIRSGEDRTVHLLDEQKLGLLQPQAVLINTSRGAVVDNQALSRWLQAHPQARAVLDVWENEPAIDARLVQQVRLATPHIAGYSYEGKRNGTLMVYRALCREFAVPEHWQPEPAEETHRIRCRGDAGAEVALYEAVSQVYAIEADSERLQRAAGQNPHELAQTFDHLRKTYPLRRDFSQYTVVLSPVSMEVATILSGFRFAVDA